MDEPPKGLRPEDLTADQQSLLLAMPTDRSVTDEELCEKLGWTKERVCQVMTELAHITTRVFPPKTVQELLASRPMSSSDYAALLYLERALALLTPKARIGFLFGGLVSEAQRQQLPMSFLRATIAMGLEAVESGRVSLVNESAKEEQTDGKPQS